MFDLRYHVASLVAVFVALIVGILVGVGLSGSGVTKKADLKAAQFERDKAEAQRDAARDQVAQLQKTQKAFQTAYPAVMSNLLADRHIGVLYVGSVDSGVNKSIADTLQDAGAGPATRMVSLSVPVDAQNIDNVLFGKGQKFVKYVGNDKLESLGNALGTEFAAGGQTPLWKALGRQLITERTGNARLPVDGVVVVRTAKPQQGDTMRFLRGLYSGLATTGIPVVGVENSNTKLSAVKVFQARGFSAVDDMDEMTGRAALALLLAGANSGTYGTGDDADGILPTPPSG
jgi:Copper transport outer membrane protein, MctB